MALTIAVKEQTDHIYLVELKGSIDNESYQELEKSFGRITHEKTRAICLDMKHVQYVSSAGIGALITEKKALQKSNAVLAIANLQPQVGKVFDMMRLSPLFAMLNDVSEIDQCLNSPHV